MVPGVDAVTTTAGAVGGNSDHLLCETVQMTVAVAEVMQYTLVKV